jgi:hypothetical protein
MMTIVALGTSAASAWERGRLAALAARQDLQDEVCIAMAGGHMSPDIRFEILSDAKSILSPAEYVAFKQALDRVSPPPPKKKPAAKQAAKQSAQLAQHKTPSSSLTRRQALQLLAEPSHTLIVPDSVVQPDRMASRGMASSGLVR